MAVESLFGVSPEALQAQRAAEQRQQAMQFAQMSPGQASQFMAYQAGSGIGNALGGMMGAKDPELEKAAQVKSLIEGVDFENLDSVRGAINQLNKAGFTREAMSLIPRVDKLSEAEADRQNKLEVAKTKQKDIILELVKSGKYTPASLSKFKESGDLSDLVAVDGTKTDRKTSWQTIGGQRVLVDDQTGETIKIGGPAGKTLEESLGTGLGQVAGIISGALAKKQAESTGAEAGKGVGQQTAMIQGKYDALSAIDEASKLVKNMYAGGYGPVQEGLAKYTGVGSKERLENTEVFRSQIGNVVIPRLQEFGGNDSVEELKYLRQVMAGETTMEPAAITRVLISADKKIRAGIKRLQMQQEDVKQGQLPSAGPVTPVVRKSWNDLK